MPVEDCLRMAAASGTAAVMQEGTRLATRAAAEELLDKVTLEEVAL
jgi:fructose-1-phosphate kinase PfkB-like protein